MDDDDNTQKLKFRIHLRADDFHRDDVRNNICHVRDHNVNGHHLHRGRDDDVHYVHVRDDDVHRYHRVHFQNFLIHLPNELFRKLFQNQKVYRTEWN